MSHKRDCEKLLRIHPRLYVKVQLRVLIKKSLHFINFPLLFMSLRRNGKCWAQVADYRFTFHTLRNFSLNWIHFKLFFWIIFHLSSTFPLSDYVKFHEGKSLKLWNSSSLPTDWEFLAISTAQLICTPTTESPNFWGNGKYFTAAQNKKPAEFQNTRNSSGERNGKLGIFP